MGHGVELLSYALQNRFVGRGIATLTVPGSGSLTSASVSLTSIDKTTDTVLISFNQNAQNTVAINAQPYIYNVVSGTGFNVGMNLDNGDVADATCFLEWEVIR